MVMDSNVGMSKMTIQLQQTRPHQSFWPARLPLAIKPPAVSLWDNLEVSARRYPDKAALVFFDRRFSYVELRNAAERLAARLAALGVQQGDRVLVMMQNCPQLVIAHYAVARANAVVVPVNPMNRSDELQHYIADADAKHAITTGDLAAELASASDALPAEKGLQHLIVTQFADAFGSVDGNAVPTQWRDWLTTQHPLPAMKAGAVHHWQDALATDAVAPELLVNSQDMALLPYTSGTTGQPKGCIHTHASIMHNALASMHWINGTPEMATLGILPLFHITGLVCVMHASIAASGTLVLMPRWDRDLASRLVSEHGVSHWICIPTMIIDLLASPDLDQYDFSSLVFIGGGGSAMPQAVAERLFERFGLRFVEGYGLTETAAATIFNPCDAPKLQCLGIPFLSVDARVVDLESSEELPTGEQGEIIIHGPQVFQGYWQREEDTAEAFVELDGKRFLRTGDLGYVDEDGYFFITDRVKRMINASGYKVWPAEIEALMFRHPGIQDVCVVAAKDEYRGETVKAYIVRQASSPQLAEEEIIDWCREQMSAYKIPRVFEFVDSLPKSGSGKVMWRMLQEESLAG